MMGEHACCPRQVVEAESSPSAGAVPPAFGAGFPGAFPGAPANGSNGSAAGGAAPPGASSSRCRDLTRERRGCKAIDKILI